jgi:hypothetical protein
MTVCRFESGGRKAGGLTPPLPARDEKSGFKDAPVRAGKDACQGTEVKTSQLTEMDFLKFRTFGSFHDGL